MSLLLFTIEYLLYYISSAATFPNDCKEINISIYGNHNKTFDGIYIVNQIFNNNILYLTKIKTQSNHDTISIKLITQTNIIMISDNKINETLLVNSFNCIHNKKYNNIILSANIHTQIKQYINNPFNDSNILITYIISAIIILLLIFSICICCCYCNNCCNCCCKKSIPSKHSDDSDNSHTNDKNNLNNTNDINGSNNDQHNITPFLPSNNVTPFQPVDNINVTKATNDKAQYLRVQMNQLNRNSTTSQYSQWSDLSNKTNQTNMSNNTVSESSTFTQDMSSRDVRNQLLYVTPKPESIIHQQSSSNNTYTDLIAIQDIIGSVSNNNQGVKLIS